MFTVFYINHRHLYALTAYSNDVACCLDNHDRARNSKY